MKQLLLILLLAIFGITNAQTIASGVQHNLVVCNDSTVKSWAWNAFGQLGNGTTTTSLFPVPVNGITSVIAVAAGEVHSLFLKSDGTVWACGWNSSGQLGDGTTISKSTPINVSVLSGITALAGGYAHSLAVKNDGTVWAWGTGSSGQLGHGTFTSNTTPVQIILTGIISISAGARHSLALKNDGTVWAWGQNVQGQLGDSTTSNKATPVKVKQLTGITAIAAGAGGNHSLALKNDGTVWSWGSNSWGQCGNTGGSIPQQVSGGLTGIIALAGGLSHSLAIKNDGTVWAWGFNDYGQLGDGTFISGGTPVQVSNITGITTVSGGDAHSLALKNDGTVWAWGRNNVGQSGTGGSGGYYNIPVQTIGLCTAKLNLSAYVTLKNISCIGANDGSAVVMPSGGTPPYTYLWSTVPIQTTDTILNLAPGNYTITVTDAVASTFKTIVAINPPSILSTSVNITNVSCNGGNNGAIDLIVNDGSGNFLYSWSNGSTTQDVSALSIGSYTVSVVDSTCNDTTVNTISIVEPPVLNLSTSMPVTICSGNCSSLSVGSTGGNGSYSYSWQPGNMTTTIINVCPTTTTTYTVTVTDVMGCTDIDSSIVTVNPAQATPTITASGTTTFCQGSSVTLTSNVGNDYSWSNGATTQSIIVSTSGNYFITITNANGCSANSSTTTVTINSLPIVSLSLNPDTVCIGGAYVLTGGSPIGGVYSGAGVSAGSFNPSVAGAGLHNIIYTYTDGNNCTNSDTAQIYVDVCTGVSDYYNSSITITPNPTTGIFTIQSTDPSTPLRVTSIEIVNVLGEKIQVDSRQLAVGKNSQISIDLSASPQGIYFLQIKTLDGVVVKKIVKE